jgi:probable addiction module antidote protein
MKTEYAPLDISSYLDGSELIAEYLAAALEDEDPRVFLAALGQVTKAQGVAKVAKKAGLGRESLYKALAPGAHPRFETVHAVMHAVGVNVAARTLDAAGKVRAKKTAAKRRGPRSRSLQAAEEPATGRAATLRGPEG